MHAFKVLAVATLIFVVCVAGLSAEQAQPGTPATTVPRVVRISGIFHPADGLAPQAGESVTVSIYAEQSGGTPLWQETQTVAVTPEGQYSVLMGASSPDGIPLDLFTTSEPRWLGVQFNRPGESERPRTQLVSVVFALKAADAETLGGKPASAYLLSSPAPPRDAAAIGAGTLTTSRQPISSASGQPVSSMSPLVTNSMATNGMDVVFTDTGGSYTGYSVQNLGGTATSYSGMLFWDQNGALGQFQGFNNATHEYRINNIAKTGGSYDGSINFMIGGNSKFRVAPNGNVGIGTTSPASTLDVAGDINFSGPLKYGGSAVLRLGIAGSKSAGLGLFAGALGNDNTAVGYAALTSMTPTFNGNDNTAVGALALATALFASDNTALGSYAGNGLTYGSLNTLVGYYAGASQISGNDNVAVGVYAGSGLTAGGNNILLGSHAGAALTAGSSNIDIGNQGMPGDSNIIRIGTGGAQTATYIVGIRGVTTGGSAVPVLVDSNGQLGTLSSSRTVKRDIENMGDTTGTIMALRPVRFRYIAHGPDGPEQYGLVAEEVAEVAPDLVAHKPDGAVETVYYDKVNAMLLNEVQKLHRVVEAQDARIGEQHAEAARQDARIRAQQAETTRQDARIRALEARLEELANRHQAAGGRRQAAIAK